MPPSPRPRREAAPAGTAGAPGVAPGDEVVVRVDRVATGGEGVARAPDGRALFVAGALPGEEVRAVVTDVRRRHARAALGEVLVPSPHRRVPPCPHVDRGCGGCDWQHASEAHQGDLRLQVVRDALERIGRLPDPVVEPGHPLPTTSLRTTVRAAVRDGRAALRRRGSHEVVVVDSCLVAHPLVEEVLVGGRFGVAHEVVVRAGARTGERVVVADPSATDVVVPPAVRVVGTDELDAGAGTSYHEEAAGRRWRISARSFFQASPEGAEALVAEVARAVDGTGGRAGRLVDLCAGVGLFAGTVGEGFDEVLAVESSPSSVGDARHNLGDAARVVRARLERWRPEPAGCVVADPPRAGLGREGVERVAATGASRVVLVSCDPGALGRDARLLAGAGYALRTARVLDLFPQTSSAEVVSTFTR